MKVSGNIFILDTDSKVHARDVMNYFDVTDDLVIDMDDKK